MGILDEDLMTPSEVAEAFSVTSKTVTRWARAGKLDSVRTLGGHRRYFRKQVQKKLKERQRNG
jgi:excisionase family DNA binding protein